jgi:hypothetical protein
MRDWKRYEEAKRLRDTGLTLKATGAAPGVCGDTVRYMLASLERREKSRVWATENPSLVPWWWGLKHGTRWELEQRGIDSRDAYMALAADELSIWRGAVALPGWEEDKDAWRRSKRKIELSMVNEVRAWLGVAPYVPVQRVANTADLERARRLLERHGWRVEPPNVRAKLPAEAGVVSPVRENGFVRRICGPVLALEACQARDTGRVQRSGRSCSRTLFS